MPEKAEKVAAPPAPFLGSLADTTDMIQGLRAEMEDINAQQAALGEKANDLGGKIAALNSLRVANGLSAL